MERDNVKFFLSRSRMAATAAVAACASLLMSAAPAQAATFKVTDNCDVPWISCSFGDLTLTYNSSAYLKSHPGETTGKARFYGNVSNYEGTSQYQGSTLSTYRYVFGDDGYEYPGGYSAPGKGQYVKNNAAAMWNCAPADNYRVYYNSSYAGASQYLRHWNGYEADCPKADLNSTLKNQNASQHFA
ncbi:hypothetical protein [Streptomyces sp. NBC_00209]|uniref:hypothetical protein n=1 Tax=Streptomyces sp. NBC_00209 TaxID=2975682 RepID=UPI003250CBDF